MALPLSTLGASKGFSRRGSPVLLEPISKSPEEDDQAGDFDKAQEVLSVVLSANEDSIAQRATGVVARD
jgi:hypothetical protein